MLKLAILINYYDIMLGCSGKQVHASDTSVNSLLINLCFRAHFMHNHLF